MQIRIDELTAKDVDYGRGPAVKLDIKSNGKKYSCFQANWNYNWEVGMTVDATVETKVVNGVTYNNLKPAGEAVKKGSDVMAAINLLNERVTKLENLLAQQSVGFKVPQGTKVVDKTIIRNEPPNFDEAPPHTDEDVPF